MQPDKENIMVQYTQAAVAKALNDAAFKVIQRQGGGIQVNLADLKSFGQDDDAKIEKLREGIDKLAAAGYPVDRKSLRLTSRDTRPGAAQNSYIPWPHFWVNAPQSSNATVDAATAAKLAAAQSIIAAAEAGAPPEVISKMAKNLGVNPPAPTETSTTPVETEASAPADTEVVEVPV